ncbi:DNA-processing protein DprA [Candidatus Binatia bacterium]|nr:DNA-processing protein DprA [Candidatus Binatia bacterium]
MDKEAALYALMLSELPHVGERLADRILSCNRERGHGLATFFRLPPAVLREVYRLPADTVAHLDVGMEAHRARCGWLLGRLTVAGGDAWCAGDAAYPRRLARRLRPPPPVLYTVGAPDLLERPTLTVLSSRMLSEHTVPATAAVAEAAAAQGFTLAGGGMKASYRVASVAARAAGAARVIVLDRGLFATFGARADRDPSGFGPGRAALDVNRTLVVSPFRLGDHASPRSGQRRDELVAALADVVVAVHAQPGGQIERVCLAALDRGQSVLSWYGENAGLVAAGATAITEADLPELGRFVSSVPE